MHGEEQTQPAPPRPIEGGQVAQAIVEYTGKRMGAVTYRGPSGREYRFSASPWDKRNYVLDEDLDHFRRFPDVRILEEGRIDPQAEEQQRREAELGDLRTQLEEQRTHHAAIAGEVAGLRHEYERRDRPGRVRKPRGRPPVPLAEVQKLWHLRHHCDPRWTIKELARTLIASGYFDPEGTISARLTRFKKTHPKLTSADQCPLCLEDDYPIPPSLS